MAIEHSESLSWLKGGKLHRFLLFSFFPVSSYLRSIGLYDSESCEDDDGEHEALKREEYIRKEEELERKIIDAIRESEQRILSFV
jgi:protein-tyrosine phosphatase